MAKAGIFHLMPQGTFAPPKTPTMQSETLLAMADKYGTPLYVYDADKMAENYRSFVASFPVKKLKVYYACKANTNVSILKLFKALGAGLDCVSIGEVQLGLMAGFPAGDIMFTPNNISEQEYDEAIALGVKLNIDNLNALEYVGHKHPGTPVCIRINPHMMAGGNRKISVGHIDSKFGISIHQVPHIKRVVKSHDIPVEGIHVHTGSDILDSSVFIRASELIFSVVEEFPEVDYIDFGSGFKIAYKEGDLCTDIPAFGREFSAAFNTFCEKMGRDYTLKFEPGKVLVSDAGHFLTKVNLVKQTTACLFAGVNSGFNHLIRPMFYDAYHHIENISNPDGDRKIYNVVGYICESDTFGSDRMLNEVRKDDILCFRNAGAYCFAMASNYNSRVRPAEVLVHQGQDFLIRTEETLEDLTRNMVQPEDLVF